ncbi:ion transport protein [Nitzschia inconspicua]|uniref:Ion transport protein n=1 Tax=Nitzschia inconspicua TaxID=303405 RepID=A0A9K3PT74_9STRA|nr:ion transport protein [Nitzschia inconspicua]
MTTRSNDTELTPLLSAGDVTKGALNHDNTALSASSSESRRYAIYLFLEAKTPGGRLYETAIIILILVNVLAFIIGSLFVEEYNDASWAQRDSEDALCNNLCDALWFGNYRDNGLQILRLGATSILELVTIFVFTTEYVLRLYLCDLEDPKYRGWIGRLRYLPTFFSIVDLASTVPFYIDAFVFTKTDMASSAFLRMFRLFRMMRVEGRYETAFFMIDDVFRAQKAILGTALFIGGTTWISVSSLYYLVERKNKDMIYCGAAPDNCGAELDTSLCEFDSWGLVDCSKAGCPPSDEFPEPCYNMYQSIPMASYYSLLNLFGEFPLIDKHSVGGQVVGTFTAVVAVAVFALPAGIIGNGFENQVQKRQDNAEESPIEEYNLITPGYVAGVYSIRNRMYNFLFALQTPGSIIFDWKINFLVIGTALTFMVDTIDDLPVGYRVYQSLFEFLAVIVFTGEYIARLYAISADPMYREKGSIWLYLTSFLPIVDVLSFVPYWVVLGVTGSIIDTSGPSNMGATFVKALRLLRIFRFEKYTHAFLSFDDVFARNIGVLSITGFSALILWVFFGAFLYYSERNNPDSEMAQNYKTIPDSMWITLLNLSGESPLAQYSIPGKIATGIVGLFATAVFGIPIGILGSGFESVIEEETEDDNRELVEVGTSNGSSLLGSRFEQRCYNIVNGYASTLAHAVETAIYVLIFTAIFIGIIQTVEGRENDFSRIEAFTVYAFTLEYILRFVGVGADPAYAEGRNGFVARLKYFVSFYSIIDLLGFVPYYIAMALPGSAIDQYDEYLRMSRILRLLKLDKFIPSFTLIDDVIRFKWNSLRVAGFAALTLWIIFGGLLYLFEYQDDKNELDDAVPIYGCIEDCTMMDRFRNYFDTFYYTGVHLTGDYPITTYSWPARFTNFFMVIAAVGVVSIPSGLIASGFVDIVQSKNKAKKDYPTEAIPGDDWYEIKYRSLSGIDAPVSNWGPQVDRMQIAVNEFLNGKKDINGSHSFSTAGYIGRVFIFTVIITNIIAVLLESVPTIDRAVGNGTGNFFDVFEAFSVFVFATEYILRLFCAPKNREALYSSLMYSRSFFGIVDVLSTAPWFIEQALILSGTIGDSDDIARTFRIFRIFRILQLEDFVTAFSKLDNVFRASKDVLKATGLMAIIIWIGGGALFFIFEQNNPNWRSCDDSIPLVSNVSEVPGCFDFPSTSACNAFYPGMCEQKVFTNMPNSLYLTAVFLGGEWGVVDFTWPGRFVCLLFCALGIALYAIPIGTLFDSFGAVLGMDGEGDEQQTADEETSKGNGQI